MKRLLNWLTPLSGLALIIVGLLGLWRCPSTLGRNFSEAFFIAGFVTFAVDPFLKRRLLKEVSEDIFRYLVGFDLPLPIRNRLSDIVRNTTLYRKDMTIYCTFRENNGKMGIDLEARYEVVNPTHGKLKYHQYFAFEKAENARIESISCSEGKKGYGDGAALALNSEGILEYAGRGIDVEPSQDTKKRYWFTAHCHIELPSPGFYVHAFKRPTIGCTLAVREKPQSLNITASPADSSAPDRWIYDKLFMQGDHINIRWESISPPGPLHYDA